MKCLCGKEMKLLAKSEKSFIPFSDKVKLWACPPEGCGRLYMEDTNSEIGGTWYLAEVDDRKGLT